MLPAGAVMEVERAAHTATRLADGRVLVTGGIRRGEAALASAEIYDPRTSDFSATGEMTSPRVGHTATLLRDGRVLIAGGWDDDAPVADGRALRPGDRPVRAGGLAERRSGCAYRDAAARRPRAPRRWRRHQHWPQPRDRRALRPADRALCEDRCDANGARGSHGYSPARRPRAAHGRHLARPRGSLGRDLRPAQRPLHHDRLAHDPPPQACGGACCANGRVLVLGGSDERDWNNRYRTAELFNPRTGRFSRTGCSSQARFKFLDAVAVTPSGAVLVAGGAQVVDRFRTGRFVPVARLDAARYFSTATLLRRRSRCSWSAATTSRSRRPRAASSTAPESRRAPRRGRARRR